MSSSAPASEPQSPRLRFARLAPARLDDFQRLMTDLHIRCYLLDGEIVTRDQCVAEITTSAELFARAGIGLWLLSPREDAAAPPIGFCGFRAFPEVQPDEPQLLYALIEAATGRGLATEAARALIDYERRLGRRRVIYSAVDAPNAASLRVLEKVGFVRTGTVPGAFGEIICVRLDLAV